MIKKIIILLCLTFKVFAFDINSGISGSWFDQNNSGQGFNIEILSGNRILVYWYAYDQGAPIWLTGVGTYQGDNASVSLDQFDGSNFGVNHQSGLVNSTPFGSLSLTFQNCNLGVADYTSIAGFGSGSIPLNRLTSMPGLECMDDNPQSTSNIVLEQLDDNSFRFNAVQGQSYVVELFNVAGSLASNRGSSCDGNTRDGIALKITDSSLTEIESSCSPRGSGNVHNFVQFTAGLSGQFQVDVIPNLASADISGKFSIRIQPKYNDSSVAWDNNFEPNNRELNAYPIDLGEQNSLSSNIEERNSSFGTSQVDFDWYQFDATPNQNYVIELYNVINLLGAQRGSNCDGNTRDGVGVKITDALFTEIASTCTPNASGNVHNRVTFKSGVGGTFHIGIIPNSTDTHGTYSLRVLPFNDDPAASWDAKFEPNNHPINAFLISSGEFITSEIEERNTSYSTNSVDIDYYRFEGEPSQTYRVELLDVASNLVTGRGSNCDGNTRDGVGLTVRDSQFVELDSQCSPIEDSNTHNFIQFRTGLSGVYYLGVIPNSDEVFGTYTLHLSKL